MLVGWISYAIDANNPITIEQMCSLYVINFFMITLYISCLIIELIMLSYKVNKLTSCWSCYESHCGSDYKEEVVGQGQQK